MYSSYNEYLKSTLWGVNRNKAYRRFKKQCAICGKRYGLEYHHYKGYEAIWTKEDVEFIVPLCRTHHFLCHFTLFGKVPLDGRTLYRRYKQVKGRWWGRLNFSKVFSFFFGDSG